MKSYTSRVLKSIAVFYATFPVSYLLFAAILFDIPADKCVRVVLSPFFYVVSALAMISGYALWEMKRWGWYVFVVANFFIAYGNALLANDYSASHHPVLAFTLSTLLVGFLGYRVGREIRVPYFFPKIRWWESNPRYKLSAPVRFDIRGGESSLDGDILDISLGGCFIKLRRDLALHEVLDLRFTVFEQEVVCRGTVVWRTQSTVTHPRGVGVKFQAPDRINRRNLRQICAKLRKLANFYRRSRYLMNQEDFMKGLDELEEKLKARQ